MFQWAIMWITIFEADINQDCNEESVKQKLRSVSFKILTQENAKHIENKMNYQAWNISTLFVFFITEYSSR